MKIKHGKLLGRKIKISGGPWGGKNVFVPSGGTMVFKIGPFHGHYDAAGEWKDVRPS